jgi:hypothetical protein
MQQDMQQGYAAETCSMEMHHGCADMQREHAAGTLSMDKEHGHAVWI